MNIVKIGAVVKTNYGTGPYKITKMHGPCTCPTYVDSINMENPPPTREHYHLTCRIVGEEKRGDDYYLGYLDLNGRSVVEDKSLAMSGDFLIFLGDEPALDIGETADMFAEVAA